MRGVAGLMRSQSCAAMSTARHPMIPWHWWGMKIDRPGDIPTKVDRAGLAHGLEVGVPLLDHLLVEWMSSLPPRLKLRGGQGKSLFKGEVAA